MRIRVFASICRCTFLIGIALMLGTAYGQELPSSSTRDIQRWRAEGLQSLAIKITVDSQTITPQPGKKGAQPRIKVVDLPLQGFVTGLAVSGDVQLNGKQSLVRLILVDHESREYLLYEVYPLITPEVAPVGGTASMSAVCQETCQLPVTRPASLRFELVSASVTITAIDLIPAFAMESSASDLESKRKQIHDAQEKEIIGLLNRRIRAAGLKWVAGPTPISHMTYAEKKRLFSGQTVPNLQGFEYYKGGVFKIFSSTDTVSAVAAETSAFVPAFDWRSRHEANNPSSPYYGGDPIGGWMTSVKTQLCSDCWAHAATGALEAGINLYYNQHLDMDLSEQELVSCSGAGTCEGGGSQAALNYIMNSGIYDNACFPETGRDDPCNPCSSPHDMFTLAGQEDIDPSLGEDNIKQRLITRGPLVFGIISWDHVMVLTGYDIDSTTGLTIWILKNSWGPTWGQNGYAYLTVPLSDMDSMSDLLSPYTSELQTYQVACRDADNDGYYNWGIGPKPSSCPSNIPDIEDCNDADSTVALQQADGSCVAENAAIGYVAPNPLTFALQLLRTTSAEKLAALTNKGNAQMVVDSVAITGDFAIVSNSNSCLKGVKPNTHCNIGVTFKPTASGSRTGTLTFVTNATNSPHVINLIGTGTEIKLSVESLAFPTQLVGTTSVKKQVNFANTGATSVSINSIGTTGDFVLSTAAVNPCPTTGTLSGGKSCNIAVSFRPTAPNTRKGSLTITDSDPATPKVVTLSGTGTIVKLSATMLSFPNTVLGYKSAAKQVTVTNVGTNRLSIASIVASGDFGQTNSCATEIAAGFSCAITVTFAPTTINLETGAITITDNGGGSPQTVSLKGTGTQVELSAASINFGKVTKGTTASKTLTLTNVGGTTLAIANFTISGTNASDFSSPANPPCAGAVAASTSCSITLRFTPSAIGTSEKATFWLFDDGGGSPQKVSLTGTGI